MRVNLGDDPAVIAIADALRLPRDCVIGKLYRLWTWADQHLADGRAHAVGHRFVDEFVAKTGFARAMQASGWLEIDEHGIAFPDFERHNGASAKARALDTKRKQTGKASGNDPDSDGRISGFEPEENRTRGRVIKNKEQEQRRATTVALPPDFGISDRVRRWAADKGYGKLEARLEHFIGKAKAKGYKYVDWDEAFMGAIRDDWAGLDDGPRSTAQPSKQVAL